MTIGSVLCFKGVSGLKWGDAKALHVYGDDIFRTDSFYLQVHELTSELEQLPRRAQLAAGFVTYLSSAPEDIRRDTMNKWCENIGLDGFDFRRFMSTESEQLGWKSEGLPSDDLSIENALVIMKVGNLTNHHRSHFLSVLILIALFFPPLSLYKKIIVAVRSIVFLTD